MTPFFHSETECQSFQGSCPLDEEPSVADNTEDNTDVRIQNTLMRIASRGILIGESVLMM